MPAQPEIARHGATCYLVSVRQSLQATKKARALRRTMTEAEARLWRFTAYSLRGPHRHSKPSSRPRDRAMS